MASLQMRNGWFHLLFRFQGCQYSHALKTQDRRQADALRGSADRVLLRIRDRELPLPPPGMDVGAYLLNGGKVAETPKVGEPAIALEDLAGRYKAAHENGAMEANSLATARMHLNHVIQYLGERFAVYSLTSQHLQAYLDSRSRKKGRRSHKLSPTTLRKEIASFRAAWNWAVRAGMVTGNFPGKGLTYPKTDEKAPFQTREEIERKIARGGLIPDQVTELWEGLFLTKQELQDFLQYAKLNSHLPFLYPMVAFAAQTGARRSELLRMLIDDVDLEGRTAVIREKKRVHGRRSTRRVPLSTFLIKALKDWLGVHPGGQYLFCHQAQVFRSKKRSRTTSYKDEGTRTTTEGRRGKQRTQAPPLGPLTRDEAHDHFRRLLGGSKWHVVKGWHVLRHSFISICAADGVDQRMLQQWVGHISQETHNRYLHLIPGREQQAIAHVFG